MKDAMEFNFPNVQYMLGTLVGIRATFAVCVSNRFQNVEQASGKRARILRLSFVCCTR